MTNETMWILGTSLPILIILIRALIYQNVKNKEFNMKLAELELKIETKFKTLENNHNNDIQHLSKLIENYIIRADKLSDDNNCAHEKVLSKIEIVKDMVNDVRIAVAANKQLVKELPKHFDSDK